MQFDTKVAILVLADLEMWQKLNVTAFLATGIASAAPEAMGEMYMNAGGRRFTRLLGQPMMILSATPEDLRRAYQQSFTRGLTCAAYIRAMFSTGDDDANRDVFLAESADGPDLVGLALRGARKDIDKAVKGAKLHP